MHGARLTPLVALLILLACNERGPPADSSRSSQKSQAHHLVVEAQQAIGRSEAASSKCAQRQNGSARPDKLVAYFLSMGRSDIKSFGKFGEDRWELYLQKADSTIAISMYLTIENGHCRTFEVYELNVRDTG